MGTLMIRRVTYSGDKYYFKSPYLNDGIVILEGDNEHGKSTFMDLIYYGLGGKILEFYKNDKKIADKHTEIYNDTNNYVELEVEINGNGYEFTRPFSENKIYIVDSNENVIETNIYRNSSEDNIIFSDWILAKLEIEVFDIVQGTKSFKLGFSDLMRLIYHDQRTEVDKIYKNPERDNFISDSLEIRKAIFEVLVGEVYTEYYSLLGQYKIKNKEFDENNVLLNSYDNFLKEVFKAELGNVKFITEALSEKYRILKRAELEREMARTERCNSDNIIKEIKNHKNTLFRMQYEKDKNYKIKRTIEESIEKIMFLIEDAEREIKEIEKIRFVNKKLNLFSLNTCPYCLSMVEREKGKCICGNNIDEDQYEKFFYSQEEYLEILKVKKKSTQSLNSLLEKKNIRLKGVKEHIELIDKDIINICNYIEDLGKDIASDYNSAYVRKIDDRIKEISNQINDLENAKELAEKKENLVNNISKIRKELDALKLKVEGKLNKAKEDMIIKKQKFNDMYNELMKNCDRYCYEAYIGEDYMPYTNRGAYRARSASVPKRLIYFLTLLILSVQYNLNYPKFLMIDTPNKEGIEPENLKKILKQLSKVYELKKDEETKFQIILTTGLSAYPRELKRNIFLTIKDDNKLLKEKSKIKL